MNFNLQSLSLPARSRPLWLSAMAASACFAFGSAAILAKPLQGKVVKAPDFASLVGAWSTDAKAVEKNPVDLTVLKDHTFLMSRMYPVKGEVVEEKGKWYLKVTKISGGDTMEEGLGYLAPTPEGKLLSMEKLGQPIPLTLASNGKTLTIGWCPAAPQFIKPTFYRIKRK